jgi:small-conductance mechanosensitive channel
MSARKLIALLHARLAILLASLILALAAPALGQTNAVVPAPPPAASPATTRPLPPPPPEWIVDNKALDGLAAALPNTHGETRLSALASQAAVILARARTAEAKANSQKVEALRDLKPLMSRPRARRGPQDRARIAALETQAAEFGRQATEAAAVAARASDLYDAVAEVRRTDFSTRVLSRSASPLSPTYWSSLAAAGAEDADRFADLAEEAARTAASAPEPRGIAILFAGAVLALLIVWPGLWLGLRLADRFTVGDDERIPLSAQRLWIALVEFGLPSLAALAVRAAANWGGLLSPKADALAGSVVVAVAWGAAILALGRALGTGRDAKQRLIPLTDDEAARGRACLFAVVLVTAAGFILTRLIFVTGASVASDVAAHDVVSLAYGVVGAGILLALSAEPPAPGAEAAANASVRGVISMFLAAALIATVIAMLAGYSTLAALISGQVFWLSLLAAVTYLLLRVIDDLVGRLFARGGWARRALASLFRLSSSSIGQIGVLSVAALQLLVMIAALSLALTPYGQSGDLLVTNLGRLGQPLRFGTATLSPTAIATGVGALVIGITLARLVRDWVVRRYLPATTWDSGVRNSVGTGVGYLGVGVALIAAMGAMGLGFQQIALIASALSVGIGFGLQQIVQNFVAGIILLIERPVKVDDWVNVDGCEGEVRRIRVRATEVRTLDRTTVIIPNSDFITKVVQNRSTGSPRGRLALQFAVTDQADLRRARDLIERTAAGQDTVLKSPAPAVFIDSLSEDGAVHLTCRVFASEPRNGDQVRTQIFQAVLDAAAEAKLALRGPAAA